MHLKIDQAFRIQVISVIYQIKKYHTVCYTNDQFEAELSIIKTNE